ALHLSLLHLLFFFSLYSSAHHPDLHSFPTRRSSDLLISRFCYKKVIFYPASSNIRNINTRLYSYNHSRCQCCICPVRQAWPFMYFQSDSMPRRVAKVFSISLFSDIIPC